MKLKMKTKSNFKSFNRHYLKLIYFSVCILGISGPSLALDNARLLAAQDKNQNLEANAKPSADAKTNDLQKSETVETGNTKVEMKKQDPLVELCKDESEKKLSLLEAKDETRFQSVQFIEEKTKVSESEMPDMTGDPRRRRGKKRKSSSKPVKTQIGTQVEMFGVAQEKLGQREFKSKCLIYKGKSITVTYELSELKQIK